jgi:hypothetical protein
MQRAIEAAKSQGKKPTCVAQKAKQKAKDKEDVFVAAAAPTNSK